MTENPYRSPEPVFDGYGAAMGGGRPTAKVPQVRVVAILMMVQGGLELLMGAFLLVMAGMMAFMFLSMAAEMPRQPGEPPPDMMATIMVAVYGGWSLLCLIPAGLHLWAGWQNYRFRRRTLGIVALTVGLVSVLSCYCAPTSIALAVYGLIIYLGDDVAQAFAMGEQGAAGEEILKSFL